jgi:hypothetical protein
MVQFLSGAIAMGYVTAGLFFLRFYAQSKDRLFMFFALAFMLLAVQRVIFVIIDSTVESNPGVLILRIIAYLLIITAIVDKNRKAKKVAAGEVLVQPGG